MPATPPQGREFEFMEDGVNIVEGAKLFTDVVTEEEEREYTAWVLARCAEGRAGKLSKPTFLQAGGARSRGNKRQALQYGGFFDFNKACPGKRGLVPPFPPWLARLAQRLVAQGYLPRTCVPNTCIINYYTRGDCIPPHVDHASYPRPICTVSLLGQEDMLLGTKYDTVGPNTFVVRSGVAVPLPRRSLLVMDGNSANIAKHCVSACVGTRISLTLRKEPPLVRRTHKKKKKHKATREHRAGAHQDVSSGGGGGNAGDAAPARNRKHSKKNKFRRKLAMLFGSDDGDGRAAGGIGGSGGGGSGGGSAAAGASPGSKKKRRKPGKTKRGADSSAAGSTKRSRKVPR